MFDGFPRTIPQAEALQALTTITHVLAIEVPDERIVERICGRSTCGNCGAVYHDTFNPFLWMDALAETTKKSEERMTMKNTVLNRLGAYHEQTAPLAAWYDERGLFHRVNGDRAIDEITTDLLGVLN